jgi:hypothetical protein
VQKVKANDETLGVLSVRNFPVDLRELINRTADHLKIERDEFVIKLLTRDLKQAAATFEEVDRRLEEIRKWWTSIERESVK